MFEAYHKIECYNLLPITNIFLLLLKVQRYIVFFKKQYKRQKYLKKRSGLLKIIYFYTIRMYRYYSVPAKY
jgi:hypothetical protein